MKVTITRLQLTCSSVPVQWEGDLSNGWKVYARSRFSRMSVSVWNPKLEGEDLLTPHFRLDARISDDRYDTCEIDQLSALVQLYVSTITFPEGT